jgi:hypothetical protein
MVSYRPRRARGLAVPGRRTRSALPTPSQEQCDNLSRRVSDSDRREQSAQHRPERSVDAAGGPAVPAASRRFPVLARHGGGRLGYLHGNCGQCHNNQHYLASKRALRLKLLVSATTPEETPTYTTAINLMMSHVIEGSMLRSCGPTQSESDLAAHEAARQVRHAADRQRLVDDAAVQTISEWIAGCPSACRKSPANGRGTEWRCFGALGCRSWADPRRVARNRAHDCGR